ncbi:MAG: bifunctional UDP-3-O-[3-hydroxymyristoyl] N-acetylglucosamine deacetylase/3-hydroxyacyl-ACP dehydratase [Bacteroidales bacterium]|nr:bifunctional UDP-3-O-[3-hydroxymyristoyl] N-acetylglucosamine deacetylase/3-hydroxyacyl-ACP dehydratase [Bacteroidales bacterium]
MVKQKTINNIISIEGKGLHTGKISKVNLCPANADEGIYFVRTDLENSPVIHADAFNVTDTARGTTLTENGVSISTVEHLLAVLFAFGIDNMRIEVSQAEIPILDGSGKYWVELINKAGIKDLEKDKRWLVINKPVHFTANDGKTEYYAVPAEDFRVTSTIDFNSELIGTQTAELKSLEEFTSDFAPCRTFVFLSEISFLIDNNLIKGGDLANAIVFADKPLTPEATDRIAAFFGKDKSEVKEERGILNTIKLQFSNEPARHKLLDFLGDISLAASNIKGHFIIMRPGHAANTDFAKQIKKDMDTMNSVPVYDPNKEPVFDIMEIRRRLPHRFPMLLIDKIIEVGDDYIVGLKNVTGNEDFFNGHFPEEPVMPGVLVVEALGQTGGMLVLKDAKPGEKYNTYFMKFEEVKFRNKVVPGDTLLLKLQQMGPIRRGIIQMKGTAYVGNKVCVEANLMAMVTKA